MSPYKKITEFSLTLCVFLGSTAALALPAPMSEQELMDASDLVVDAGCVAIECEGPPVEDAEKTTTTYLSTLHPSQSYKGVHPKSIRIRGYTEQWKGMQPVGGWHQEPVPEGWAGKLYLKHENDDTYTKVWWNGMKENTALSLPLPLPDCTSGTGGAGGTAGGGGQGGGGAGSSGSGATGGESPADAGQAGAGGAGQGGAGQGGAGQGGAGQGGAGQGGAPQAGGSAAGTAGSGTSGVGETGGRGAVVTGGTGGDLAADSSSGGGCDCRATGSPRSPALPALLLIALISILLRRRGKRGG